jgi:hypothetical protein
VRRALAELERYTLRRFPDYSYFKVKALEVNEPNVRQMLKTLSLEHESWNVCYLNTLIYILLILFTCLFDMCLYHSVVGHVSQRLLTHGSWPWRSVTSDPGAVGMGIQGVRRVSSTRWF